MALNSEQRRVLNRILAGARRNNASPKELKAAIQTGIVESNLRNLKYGDRDSQGWRQERASLYKDPTNLDASIDRFFRETSAVKDRYGRAGELAAAVQRPAAQFRGRYEQVSGQADQLMRGAGGVGRGGGGGSSGGGGSLPSDQSGDRSSALVSLLSQQQLRPQASVSAPSAPAFSASQVLPKGYQSVQGSTPAGPGSSSLAEQLAAIAESADTSVPQMPSSGSGGGSASSGVSQGPGGAGRYPLARKGKLIGTPRAGTHTLGNWQSDNAVDLRVAEGTPIRALEDGVIGKVKDRASGGGRFGGGQITLEGSGNSYFYGHTSRVNVKPGQRVKKGQIIGRTGTANGVPHLHLGVRRGDPRRIIGQGR